MGPTLSRHVAPIGWDIARKERPPVIGRSLVASNSGIAWAEKVESATTFQSLNGCAGGPMSARSLGSGPLRASIPPTRGHFCKVFSESASYPGKFGDDR